MKARGEARRAKGIVPLLNLILALLLFAGASSKILMDVGSMLLSRRGFDREIMGEIGAALEYAVIGFGFLTLHKILTDLGRVQEQLGAINEASTAQLENKAAAIWRERRAAR